MTKKTASNKTNCNFKKAQLHTLKEQQIVDNFLADCRKIYERGGGLGECWVLETEDRYMEHFYILWEYRQEVEDKVNEIWGVSESVRNRISNLEWNSLTKFSKI